MCLLSGCREKELTNYQLGVESLEEQNYTQAIEYFQDAAEEEEESAKAWRGIGISQTEQGIFDEAEKAFSKALKLTDKKEKAMKADLYLYLADARYHQADYEGCIKACEKLLEIQKTKEGYFLRGSAYLHMGEYSKADKDFSKVISKSEEYEDYLDIYKVYSECNLNADGGEYLEDALDIEPKTAEDYYNRGRTYYYLSEYKNAEKELKKALKKKDMRASVYLGKVYVAAGDIKKAEDMYKTSLEAEEVQAEAYNGLAYCAISDGDYDEALKYIKKGLKINNPEVNQALLFNEIVVYERKLDFASAKKKIKTYLEMYPADEAAVRENYFLQTR